MDPWQTLRALRALPLVAATAGDEAIDGADAVDALAAIRAQLDAALDDAPGARHPGAEALARELADVGLHTAGAAVRLDVRALAPIIGGEVVGRAVGGVEMLVQAVDAWGAGDDARVAVALARWTAARDGD